MTVEQYFGLENLMGNWEDLMKPGGPSKILYLTGHDLSKTGNVVAFGPVAQEYSELEALLIVVAFKKFMDTPEGQKYLRDIIVEYLKSMATVVSSMQKSSSSNAMTALMNQYSITNVFKRIGLITAFDATQTKVWLDHYFGELLKLTYVGEIVGGLTTLVDATSTTEKYGEEEIISKTAGLATLAKVFEHIKI